MSHVVIVGAGPAGASLAYLLARQAIDVTLIERRRDFDREFRGEVLMPSGIEAFAQMGLRDALETAPTCDVPAGEVYLNKRKVFGIELNPPRFMAISQPAVLEMLVEKASAYTNFTLIRGASVRDIAHEQGRVAGVTVRHDDDEESLHCDLVIGADGRNSIVRRILDLEVREIGAPMDIVWCKLPCPDDWPGVRGFAGRGHLLVAYRTWDAALQLGWVILKGTFGDLRARGIEAWVEEMANHVTPDFAAHLLEHREAIHKPFLLDVVADRVNTWWQSGALVIGDAAHTMSPVGGQGINIALRDAIVASNHLTPCLADDAVDPTQLDAALDAIQKERVVEVEQIQALQAVPPKIVLSRAWWGDPVRGLFGRLIQLPRVQQRAGQRVGAFLHGVTEVELAQPLS